MNKRGQFYLISAIIIVVILLGFSSIKNHVSRNTFDKGEIYELMKNPIRYEDVLNYDVITQGNFDMETNVRDFVNLYSNYFSGSREIFFLVGKKQGQDIVSEEFHYNYKDGVYNNGVSDSEVKGIFNNYKNSLELEDEEKFYFIVVYELNEERYSIYEEDI